MKLQSEERSHEGPSTYVSTGTRRSGLYTGDCSDQRAARAVYGQRRVAEPGIRHRTAARRDHHQPLVAEFGTGAAGWRTSAERSERASEAAAEKQAGGADSD